MEILKWLNESSVVINYEVIDYKTFSSGFYIKIKAVLINSSTLFIAEYSDSHERNYSYHWQDKDSRLIVRWDNAPHHPTLFTQPHHKHRDDGILPSNEIFLKDVLRIIEKEKEG